MNWLDLVFLLILIYALFKGFKSGLILELFTLLAILVGLYVAIHFSDYTVQKINDDFEIEKLYLEPLAFIITFLVIGAGIYFLGKVLEKMIKTTGLSPLNRIAGMAFGLLKMVYILSAILIFLESLEERGQITNTAWRDESKFYTPIVTIGKSTIPNIKESTLFIENALASEKEETGLSVDEILRAKQIADSLGLDANDAQQVQEIHKKYGSKN